MKITNLIVGVVRQLTQVIDEVSKEGKIKKTEGGVKVIEMK